jgi:hypothetical protein
LDDRGANKTVAASMPAAISIQDGAALQILNFPGKATPQPSTRLRLSILELIVATRLASSEPRR